MQDRLGWPVPSHFDGEVKACFVNSVFLCPLILIEKEVDAVF